jgi:alkylated DNA repair protein (DNA oxidative demethylase)
MTPASRAGQEELFDSGSLQAATVEQLEPGAFVLRAFAVEQAAALLNAVELVARSAPLRHMTTPRGWRMSVAMTNCGDAGWLSDRSGYRYDAIDPETNRPWPAMPGILLISPRAPPAPRASPGSCQMHASSTGTSPARG